MILDKKIEIKVHTKNIKTLKEEGFNDIKIGDIVIGDVNLLPPNSHIKINVKCDVCGKIKKIQYRYYKESVSKYNLYTCSSKCAQFKNKKTNLEKYGTEYITQNVDIKEKIKNTVIKNYGVDNIFKSNIIKEQIKETNIKNYGFENVSSSEIIKKKREKTNLDNYGSKFFVNSESFYNKVNYYRSVLNQDYINNIKERLKSKYNLDLLDIYKNDNKIIYKLKCDNGHDHIFECESDMLRHRLKYNTVLCTTCNKKNSYTKSGLEMKILSFIRDNYDLTIIENFRINNKEIDIYLPDLKIGFEVNGIWWHNELYVHKNYHKEKKEVCKENDINLFFIYEDEWIYKKEIVKSMILHKLKKTSNRYYARKCVIKEITNKQAILFLDKNHIQGRTNSSINIALYNGGELLSMISFNKRRLGIGNTKKISDNDYELVRFCSKLNTSIVGGANKLFKYFIKNYKFNNIISFANLDYSNGDVYYTLGFELLETQKPNYYYVYDKKRKHRFSFRKDKLVKEGYDINKTEHEIMLERKIYRIYNSGVLKFIYKKLE